MVAVLIEDVALQKHQFLERCAAHFVRPDMHDRLRLGFASVFAESGSIVEGSVIALAARAMDRRWKASRARLRAQLYGYILARDKEEKLNQRHELTLPKLLNVRQTVAL